MTLLRFETGGQVLQFTVGSSYPSAGPTRIFGTQDRTAAGTLQYEELGITILTRALNFVRMPTADYEALIDWFENVAQGGKNSFTFTDEYGLVGDVVITDQIIDFPEIFLGRHDGILNLEYVTVPT